jgi:hypothetical protein
MNTSLEKQTVLTLVELVGIVAVGERGGGKAVVVTMRQSGGKEGGGGNEAAKQRRGGCSKVVAIGFLADGEEADGLRKPML